MDNDDASTLRQRCPAEAVGIALLLAMVVGSGIMAQRLCDSTGLALLANALAIGSGLLALITALGGISGAHGNLVVSVMAAVDGGLRARELPWYVAAQVTGGIAGVVLAHAMFELPPVQFTGASAAVRAAGSARLSPIPGCSSSSPAPAATSAPPSLRRSPATSRMSASATASPSAWARRKKGTSPPALLDLRPPKDTA